MLASKLLNPRGLSIAPKDKLFLILYPYYQYRRTGLISGQYSLEQINKIGGNSRFGNKANEHSAVRSRTT
jgi:hypothetical protein